MSERALRRDAKKFNLHVACCDKNCLLERDASESDKKLVSAFGLCNDEKRNSINCRETASTDKCIYNFSLYHYYNHYR